MSYFNNFPNIVYPFYIKDKLELRSVKDIVLNVRVRQEIIANISFYDTYDIQEGETPEIIAEKLYGDAGLHWVIMLANDRYDFYNDFPLSQEQLDIYVENKYGAGNENDQHIIFGELHFEDYLGNIVDGPATETTLAITNLEYETRVNDSKRRIKVINPGIVPQIITEIENSFTGFSA